MNEIFQFRQYLENQGIISLEVVETASRQAKKAASKQTVQDYIEARMDSEAMEEALADLGVHYQLNHKASLLYMMAKVELSHISHRPAVYFVKEWLLGVPYIVDLPISYDEQREQMLAWGLVEPAMLYDIDISNAYYTLIAEAIKHAATLEKVQANILQQSLI